MKIEENLLENKCHYRVEYNSLSSVIDRPTGVHDRTQSALIGHIYMTDKSVIVTAWMVLVGNQ